MLAALSEGDGRLGGTAAAMETLGTLNIFECVITRFIYLFLITRFILLVLQLIDVYVSYSVTYTTNTSNL